MTLPFNRVVVTSSAGVQRMTVAEFTGMPLVERVRAVLEQRVEFLLDEQRIETRDALNALRNR
jgi:hypothetical protein